MTEPENLHHHSEIRDGDGTLKQEMCCTCFAFLDIDRMYVDEQGHRHKMCQACAGEA